MFVLPINSINNNQRAFYGNRRFVFRNNGYATNTWLFRNDFDWKSMSSFLAEKYKDVSEVHVIDHACSSGHETYSVAAKLLSDLGERAAKFFPIIAKDVDIDNIRMALEEDLELEDEYAEGRLSKHLPDYERYFQVYHHGDGSGKEKDYAHPTNVLQSKIEFYVADLIKDIDENVPAENTVLFCRNFWPYLTVGQQDILLRKIKDKFQDDSSLIAIGCFDISQAEIDEKLKNMGFEETGLKNVYCRRTK